MKKEFGMFYEGPGPGKQDPMDFTGNPYNLFYHGSGKPGADYDPNKAKSDLSFYHHEKNDLHHIHSLAS